MAFLSRHGRHRRPEHVLAFLVIIALHGLLNTFGVKPGPAAVGRERLVHSSAWR